MDFFDDILGRIIPIFIVFVILRNVLTVIFGRRPQNDDSQSEESEQYEEQETYETEQGNDSLSEEQRKILEEFEQAMQTPKEPLPIEVQPVKPQPQKTEQKIVHDGETTVIHKDDEPIAHDNKGVIHRDDEKFMHDNKGVILKDAVDYERDNSKIYKEKPLIEEEEVQHVALSENKMVTRSRPRYPQLVNMIKWAEILGQPKGM